MQIFYNNDKITVLCTFTNFNNLSATKIWVRCTHYISHP